MQSYIERIEALLDEDELLRFREEQLDIIKELPSDLGPRF